MFGSAVLHLQKQTSKLFYKKAAFKNFAIFAWKHLHLSLFFNVSGLHIEIFSEQVHSWEI